MLTIEETLRVLQTLRNLLRLPLFPTKAAHMGQVIRVRPSGIDG